MSDYQLDLTGMNPNNLLIETQYLSQLNTGYQVIIPKVCPFFLDNLVVIEKSIPPRTLTKGVDYEVILPFMAATRFVAKPIYGGLIFLDRSLSNPIELQYQTLGGVYTTDYQELLEKLIEQSLNPRLVYYDQLVDMPAYFPPAPHSEDAGSFTYKDLIEKINALTLTIANKQSTQRAYILYRPAAPEEVLDETAVDVVLTPSNTAGILNDILSRLQALEQ